MAASNVALAESLHAKEAKMAPEQVNMRDVTGIRHVPDGAGGTVEKRLDQVQPRQQGVMDEQFPTDALTAKDARDRVMEAKLRLQTDPNAPGYTPFGKLEAKDSDFEWYQQKAAAVEVANFQAWFAREFDRMSPADKKRAKELYPEFYKQRKRLLKQQTKNLFELARLKLEGVQDMDDLRTQYLAESGRLDLGPLQNLLHPEVDAGGQAMQMTDAGRRLYAQDKFQRGLLSPFRVFGPEAVPTRVGLNNDPRTGAAMRDQERLYYQGVQPSTAVTYLGINNNGYPPFAGANVAQQGDQQWWQLLRGAQ